MNIKNRSVLCGKEVLDRHGGHNPRPLPRKMPLGTVIDRKACDECQPRIVAARILVHESEVKQKPFPKCVRQGNESVSITGSTVLEINAITEMFPLRGFRQSVVELEPATKVKLSCLCKGDNFVECFFWGNKIKKWVYLDVPMKVWMMLRAGKPESKVLGYLKRISRTLDAWEETLRPLVSEGRLAYHAGLEVVGLVFNGSERKADTLFREFCTEYGVSLSA